MSKRDEIIAILREWHWDGGTEAVADRILACVAESGMGPAEEAAIRARDADCTTTQRLRENGPANIAHLDRRILLAELDRLRALLAKPTKDMVSEALGEWWDGAGREGATVRSRMRAALVAAGRAMVTK